MSAGDITLPDGVQLAADAESIIAVVSLPPTAEQGEGEGEASAAAG